MVESVVCQGRLFTGFPVGSTTDTVRESPTTMLKLCGCIWYGNDDVIVKVGPVMVSDPCCTVTVPLVVFAAIAPTIWKSVQVKTEMGTLPIVAEPLP